MSWQETHTVLVRLEHVDQADMMSALHRVLDAGRSMDGTTVAVVPPRGQVLADAAGVLASAAVAAAAVWVLVWAGRGIAGAR